MNEKKRRRTYVRDMLWVEPVTVSPSRSTTKLEIVTPKDRSVVLEFTDYELIELTASIQGVAKKRLRDARDFVRSVGATEDQ